MHVTIEEDRRVIPWDKLTNLKQLAEIVELKQIDKESLEIDAVMGDRVLVQEVKPYDAIDEALERSGIHAPEGHWNPDTNRYQETRRAASCSGLLLQVGDKVTDKRLTPGAMVLFSEYGGTPYKIGGIGVRVLDADEVICTLRAVDGKRLMEVVVPAAKGKE